MDLPRWLDRAAFGSVLLLTALSGLSGGGLNPQGLLALRAVSLLGTAAWVLGVVHGGRMVLPPRRILIALLVLVGWSGVSAVLSAARPSSLEAATSGLLDLAAVLLGCTVVRTPGRRRLWLTVLLASAAVLGGYGLVQALGLGWTPRLSAARVSSLYFNSNHYAGFLALLTPLTLALWVSGRPLTRGRRLALAVLSLVLATTLFLSFSWATVPVVCSGAVLVWTAYSGTLRRRPGWALGLGAGIASLLLCVMVLASPQLAARTPTARITELTGTWVRDSLESRWLIWRGSARVIWASPLLGVGPGHFEAAFTRYRTQTRQGFAQGLTHAAVNYAHNDLLQVGAETGVPGLVAFVAFWSLALRGGRGPLAPPLRAGLLGLLVYGLVDCNLTQVPGNALLAYLCAGVLLGTGAALPLERQQGQPAVDLRLAVVVDPAAEQDGRHGGPVGDRVRADHG